MFFITYILIASFDHFHVNINRIYMALIMAAPMVIVMLLVMRSMIPHHSSAILMCEQSNITDPEIVELCGQIIETQVEEIAQMEAIIERYR